MLVRSSALGCFVAGVLISGFVTAQEKFEPTAGATRRALQQGKIAEALAFHELKALQAEKDASASSQPEQYLETAWASYKEACRAARLSGQVQKMFIYGEKALEMARKIAKPERELNAINEMIYVHRYIRNYDKVSEFIEQGLAIVRSLPAHSRARLFWEGALYGHVGPEHTRRGEYTNAIEALSRSVSSFEGFLASIPGNSIQTRTLRETGRGSLLIRLSELGNAYHQANKLPEALEQYQRAFAFIKEWGFKYAYEGDLHRNVGEIHFRQNQFPNALESFNRALALAEGQGHATRIMSASNRIGNLLVVSGQPAKAIAYYQKAIQQIESARSLLPSEDYRQSYFEAGLSTYVSMIETLLTTGKPEEAFNYSERARSRSFLDILGNKVQLARSGTLLEHQRALLARISVLKAMVEEQEADSAGASDLKKDLVDAERAYNEYLSQIRKENKEQASLMNVEPLTLKQVQERLDPGVTMLEYFVARNAVWLWVVERDRVELVTTAIPRSDLVSKVTSLRDAINQFAEKERFSALSQELYRLLIEPALPHIKGKELIIVPHDLLHYLPFQTLLGADNRYLIEKYPIYYLSSASLMQFTQEKRKAKGELTSVIAQGGKVLTFGNPDLGDPKMSLQYAGVEAKEIKSLYPQSNIYLEKEATEARAKELSSQNDIIHFASHAELSEDDPLASAILLAKSDKEDGRLEVREIFGMDLKASLVVLSACETGLGKLSSGDELVGLTRAFIYAGTPSVVASLWNVEDSSTAQLMASFYKNIKTMTKVEALRQAQLQLIRGNINSDLLARKDMGGAGKLGETPSVQLPAPSSVTTSHPYFWAPFILVGEGK